VNQTRKWNSYITVNLIFTGIIVSIIVYSWIFTPEGRKYPVASGSSWFGETTQSSGLSRSFSEIVRFRFTQAKQYNPFGIRIFLFFTIQLLMRILLSILVMYKLSGREGKVILADVIITVSLFVICFWPFMVALISEFVQIIHQT